MNHAKRVRTSSGLSYADSHHRDHVLWVHLLWNHPLLVRLLLGAPEIQTKLGIADASQPLTKTVARQQAKKKGHPRNTQQCLPQACQESTRRAHRIHLLMGTRHHGSYLFGRNSATEVYNWRKKWWRIFHCGVLIPWMGPPYNQ